MATGKKTKGIGVTLLTVVIAVLIMLRQGGENGGQVETPPPGDEPRTTSVQRGGGSAAAEQTAGELGEDAILAAFRAKRSDVMVEIRARVSRLLRDDNEGSRHQRFIVEFEDSRHTVLISHNIDLAERVPIDEGDWVRVKGEYEWSDPGGVIHWTHHNPARNPIHPGGWIEHEGTRYE